MTAKQIYKVIRHYRKLNNNDDYVLDNYVISKLSEIKKPSDLIKTQVFTAKVIFSIMYVLSLNEV